MIVCGQHKLDQLHTKKCTYLIPHTYNKKHPSWTNLVDEYFFNLKALVKTGLAIGLGLEVKSKLSHKS